MVGILVVQMLSLMATETLVNGRPSCNGLGSKVETRALTLPFVSRIACFQLEMWDEYLARICECGTFLHLDKAGASIARVRAVGNLGRGALDDRTKARFVLVCMPKALEFNNGKQSPNSGPITFLLAIDFAPL